MFLYFIETTKESEEENISQRIVGFPEIIELENNAKK